MARSKAAWTVAVLLAAAAIASGGERPQLVIVGAVAEEQTLYIHGLNFTWAGETTVSVWLNGEALSVDPSMTTATSIVAQMALPVPSWTPGTYLLKVSRGPATVQNDTFIVAIGAVGPPGPEGPKGDKGDVGETGPQGEQGIQGAPGLRGADGAKGDQGDPGLPGLVARGPWDSGVADYRQNDVVTDDGSTWRCIVTACTKGNKPMVPNAEWQLLAAKGDTGQQGLQGVAGAQGTQGEPGPIGPQGPQGDQGPQGEQGPTGSVGPIGPVGPPGLSAKGQWFTGTGYVVNDVVTDAGSTWRCQVTACEEDSRPSPANAEWELLAVKGDTGPQGPKGDTGEQGVQGPIGSAGPQGPAGPSGAGGVSQYQRLFGRRELPPGLSTASVPCPEGTLVFGGGLGAAPENVSLVRSYPGLGTQWILLLRNSDASAHEVMAYAICGTAQAASACNDADDDGFEGEAGCTTAADCDDGAPEVHPGAGEICGDGRDNDCSGVVDDSCVCATDSDCLVGQHCGPQNHCVGGGSGGSTCVNDQQCLSGNCVDGVC